MALWTSTNRGGGRALGLAIPGAKHGDENGNDVSDRKRESGGSGIGEMAGFVVKKGTRKAAKMVFETGESKAKGKKESWGYWKETTQKMKEDLLGTEHEKSPHHYGCHVND